MSQPIKSRWTLEECYLALDVHPKTFRRWLEEDHVTTETSKADKRIKYLTAQQIEQLARWHEKPWPPAAISEPEIIPVQSYKLVVEQVAEAEQQVAQLSVEQITLQANLETLRQESAERLDAIRHDLAEQAGTTTESFASVMGTMEMLRTELERIGARQQEAYTRIDALVTVTGNHQRDIFQLQTKHKQDRVDLDALAEASREQAEQLTQLTARIEAQESDVQAQLEQAKAEAQEQLQQALKGMNAEYQAALHILRREMQAELAAAIQSTEQDEVRDVAALTAQQKQLQTQLENAATRSEAAAMTALGDQRRIDGVEEKLNSLTQQLQTEQSARAFLTERVDQLTQRQTQAAAPEQPRKRKPGRKPKQISSGPTS